MSVSLCVLRVEIDEDLPEMAENPAEIEAAKEQKKRDRGARDTKTITVETYASVLTGPNTDTGILPTSSKRTPPKGTGEEETISFFCGNPLIEVTKGVLHLYKENELKEAEEAKEAKTLCLLSVPGALGASDLLAFAAACQQDIAHVRVLRDGSPDHYMALLTFRSTAAAREFHREFDGVPYSTLEPGAVCHIAWVSRVEWSLDGAPPPSHTELPTCPVCLERMDESVAGVLSVQCAHAFHAECLAAWRDARCPVCRAAQVPDPATPVACQMCVAEQETPDAPQREVVDVAEGLLDVEAGTLWICLICGHVGCGRYEGGHAAKHYLQSNHTYALQIGSNRVWDYAGDNFVHRLVQNKPDGKLVAAGPDDTNCPQDKLDSAQLEFTYLLTHQLDVQRQYYQRKIDKMEADHKAECDELRARASEAESEAKQLKEQVNTLARDNKNLEKKMQTLNNKVTALQSSLSEERALARALAASREQATARDEAHTQEIAELREQLRDVMFFLEARDKLQESGTSSAELANASVSVPPPTKPRRTMRKRPNKQH